MGCKHIPITPGTKFGRLTSTSEISQPTSKGEYYYKCNCICGSEPKFYATWKLKSGHTKSCNCLRRDVRKLKGRLNLIKRGIKLSKSELDWITNMQNELKE